MMVQNREKVIQIEKDLEHNTSSVKIQMGCGSRVWGNNWINIDLYSEHIGVVKQDITTPNYPENYADIIYSSHSAEHLPYRKSLLAFQNWYKILKRGGELYLMLPDLHVIMAKLLDESLPEAHYQWYLATLYGWQQNQNIRDVLLTHPIAPGEFHCSGYSKERLEKTLTNIGYEIKDSFRYCGYNTPSLYVRAVK